MPPKRPKVEPIRNSTLFEMDKLEQAGRLVNSLNVERPYSEPGLLLGTSAFTANGWPGAFYPPGMKPRDFLSYYARQFKTVEVDSTFSTEHQDSRLAPLGAERAVLLPPQHRETPILTEFGLNSSRYFPRREACHYIHRSLNSKGGSFWNGGSNVPIFAVLIIIIGVVITGDENLSMTADFEKFAAFRCSITANHSTIVDYKRVGEAEV